MNGTTKPVVARASTTAKPGRQSRRISPLAAGRPPTELLALAVGLTAAGALAALVTGARRRFRDRNGPATG
ncbi:hypothetical protein CLM83_12310 [Streptomyces albidoflavus]|uniref:hypothetical protein n=1 Tax=Streptomyces albidoflavus TaxID=1886 RepID=UPI000BB648FB|nr:hypothetical protein [Streptomyces albidoflavus]PBO18434.1 hypothetical protein CLM83_12310 [Streptomyces albidoflavus]